MLEPVVGLLYLVDVYPKPCVVLGCRYQAMFVRLEHVTDNGIV